MSQKAIIVNHGDPITILAASIRVCRCSKTTV
jgi:hypothetical protein